MRQRTGGGEDGDVDLCGHVGCVEGECGVCGVWGGEGGRAVANGAVEDEEGEAQRVGRRMSADAVGKVSWFFFFLWVGGGEVGGVRVKDGRC